MSQLQNQQPSQPSNNNNQGSDEIALQSRLLQHASFNSSSLMLTLSFHNGQQISYWPVYPATWEAFKEAPSKGSFYIRQIKGKANAIKLQRPLQPSVLKRTPQNGYKRTKI